MASKFRKLTHCFLLVLLLVNEPMAKDGAKKEPVAVIDGEAITSGQLEGSLAPQLTQIEEQIYALKRQKMEELIQSRLLAHAAVKRGLTVPQLLEIEVNSKVSPVNDKDVEAHYQANKDRYPASNYRDQIRSQLQNQRREARRKAFIDALRSQAKVVVHLPAPAIYRADVSIAGAPLRGSVSAPVTIVEFSDFHCPYCRQVQPTLTRILSQYNNRVKLAYRDLPLERLHPNARTAAEAARCARDQGKFWEYHDKLYSAGADTAPEKLKALAKEVGTDVSAFGECLASGRHRPEVEKDSTEAARLGITGTPSFFINGRSLRGSQSQESFATIIDEELKLSSRISPGGRDR